MTGMDQSPEMLAVARRKSHDTTDIRWAEADMQSFDLGERYGLVLVPAHSFQFMLTPADQVSCLEAIKRHLDPQGTVIIHLDHQDIDWLGNLPAARADDGERERILRHPVTGRSFRRVLAWSYERSTQTAAVVVEWEELDQDGTVIARRTQDPMPLHCVFPFEMDHLLGRVGLKIEALYGDFFRRALHSGSSEMIWVARPHQR
jgi:SAM-dependent methyltransferase